MEPNPAAIDESPVPEAFAAALEAAERTPDHSDRWDELEEQAAALQRPDPVAELYRRVLDTAIAPELVVQLGQRAARFHDEWFEDALPLAVVLKRVLDVDPTADWAFHRLSLLLTRTERWDELLALYDRALAGTTDKARRIQLLDDAAHVAKDFAGQPDRAIHYLEQLFPLKPSDTQLATSLERLFEKQGRYEDLIKLWTARLGVLPPEAARTTRARIAACWLDHLHQPGEALRAVDGLLADGGDDAVACALLERIVVLPEATAEIRTRALTLLRERYDAAKRHGDVVRVLEGALAFADRVQKISLHGEITTRLTAQDRHEEAIAHASALVVLDPAAPDAQAQLRALAERTGRHDRFASALAEAADASSDPSQQIALRVEAASTRHEVLHDEAGAMELYAQVLAAPEASHDVLLGVARTQAQLLERAGRTREQLDVLERLARLETDDHEVRAALGRAARLAESLDATDRALASWQTRLDRDGADLEALDAMVALLDRSERWEPLIAALRRRAGALTDVVARRADLVRIARVQAERLGAVEAAIRAWSEVADAFGQNYETVDALSALLATAERWKDLAKLLDGAAQDEPDLTRKAQLLHRLGDVQREHLETLKKATKSYKEALEADPRNEGARAGLRVLLGDEKCLPAAVETLARAYAETDEWSLTLEILEPRLSVAKQPVAKAALLLEAAQIQEQRAQDLVAALGSIRRALPLTPEDRAIENELLRLAERTDGWQAAVDAYRDAIVAEGDASDRVAELELQQGVLLETRLADSAGALAAYQRVIALRPGHLEATASAVRVAAHADAWDAVASALVGSAKARETVDPALFDSIELTAGGRNAWSAATEAVERAVARERGLRPPQAREIETRVALWHRDQRHDADAAEAALLRAVAHDGSDADTLRMLADLQRRVPGRPLVDTLLRLADTRGEDQLDALYEASQVSLHLDGERELLRSTLRKLLEGASAQWQHSTEPFGRQTPEAFASFALEELVKLHGDAGEHGVAVDLLVDGAKLPFPAEASRTMRHKAAEISSEQLNDGARAIELYRTILAEAPSDVQAIRRLAALYASNERLTDLLALHRHELDLLPPVDRRLDLRIDIARVLGVLGDREARIQTLRDNLEEAPGHEPSIAELSSVLEAEGSFALLADLLADQATRLETIEASTTASALWGRVANLAEAHLGDVPRAVQSHRRVVALGATHESLDALARLHVARGEHADAVGWLEQRLESTLPGARAATVVLLAQAQLGAGQGDRALASLERAITEDPGALDVRTLLAEQYRKRGAWEPLARLLHDGASHVTDTAAQLTYLRESAEIYLGRLGEADTAIPIFERAIVLAPQDRTVRTALAAALRAANRLDEARALLESLIAEFGRRRPPERAAVHYQLAQIARARGDNTEALAQLDVAASMDMQHPGIHRLLGDLARESGQFDRAEKAYRALLLIVRRQNVETLTPEELGASEVLFELYRLATQLGEPDRAREILESAFETASQGESEAKRFERALRAHGDPELLLRSLQNRLAHAEDPEASASILADLADVLTGLGRVNEALDASVKALAAAPGSVALHDAARALAQRAGAPAKYTEAVEAMAARAKEQGDVGTACDLYLRLGEVAETELNDPAAAAGFYAQAEATGDRQIEAWRALERMHARLGHTGEQVRVLRAFVNAGVEGAQVAEQTEALYRLAEIELRDADLRDEGVDMLGWALDREPQYERAAEMLRSATAAAPDHERAVQLFERVARASGEPGVLLDALERSAALATVDPELLREAVEIAQQASAFDRAEALLRRAVDLAAAREALGEAVWALVALAERRKGANDLRGAVERLQQAAEVADAGESFQYALEVATLAAGPLGDLRLAAVTYERLREKDPADRNVWEPLLGVYRQLDDRERLAELIATTLESVFDPGERNRLRMERARLLLAEGEKDDEAITALRDILEEDPSEVAAAAILIDVFERTGRTEDLADLVRRQLDAARDRGDGAQVGSLSLRLGGMLAATRRTDAIDVYRASLEWAPENRDVLRALVALYVPDDDLADRADAMEKLVALERGAEASMLALDLVALRETQSDDSGVERALALGFRGHPQHEPIRARLGQWYAEREDWVHLAEMLMIDAASRTKPDEIATLMREAAEIYRNRLQSAGEAAGVLRRARALLPNDLELLKETARALSAAGDHDAAAQEVDAGLESHVDDVAVRADLLRVRGQLRVAQGDDTAGVEDLEEALRLGGSSYLEDLSAGLEQRREKTFERGDRDDERATILRLVEVYGSLGDTERPRNVLADWVARESTDKAALHMLAELDATAGRWDAAAETFQALVDAETGAGQADAVLRLADACDRAGRPGDARASLELVQQAMPQHEGVRTQLRKLYEQIGAFRELADICLSEAEHAGDDAARFPFLRRAGELRLKAGESDAVAAIEPLEQALKIKPGDHETTLLLADAYTHAGRVAEASGMLDAAIAAQKGRRSRELAALQHRMARVAYAAGDRNVELAWLNVALDSDMQSGQIAAELADVAMELGQSEIAMKALRAVTLMKNPHPMSRALAFLKQGMLARTGGDGRKAIFLAKKALSEDPNLVEATAFLQELGE